MSKCMQSIIYQEHRSNVVFNTERKKKILGLKPPLMQLCVDIHKPKIAGQGWFNALRRKMPLEKALHSHRIIIF